jgi:hypothetical protein
MPAMGAGAAITFGGPGIDQDAGAARTRAWAFDVGNLVQLSTFGANHNVCRMPRVVGD